MWTDFSSVQASFDRINPLYGLEEDFYFKAELEAMLRLLWPLPAPEDIVQLKELLKARANYVMMRHMVSQCPPGSCRCMLKSNWHNSMPSSFTHGITFVVVLHPPAGLTSFGEGS